MPVGGQEASFFGSANLSEAIEKILGNKHALEVFLELRVSASEIDAQGTGGTARIIYKDGDREKTTFFVHETAISLFTKGAERNYNPRAALLQISTDIVYYPELFHRIARSLEGEQEQKEIDNLIASQGNTL